MDHKQPSSLDFTSLLHELTLKKWLRSILNEDWHQAGVAAGKMAESSERFWKWLGLINLSQTRLYRGESAASLSLLEEAAQAYPDSEALSSSARAAAAHVLLEAGRAEQALEQARRALPYREAVFYLALAQARLGNAKEAERTARELRPRSEAAGSEAEKARYYQLKGELALSNGRIAPATRELSRAESMLPAESSEIPGQSLHVPIWYSRAACDLAAGDMESAAKGFRRITTSFSLHVDWPILYVRSFYFLGRIHDKRAEKERAREDYGRFVEFWKDGDLDRERVHEAQNKA